MKTNILSLLGALVLSVSALADTHTLGIYTDGCETPDVVTCPTGTEVSVTATAVLPGSYFVRWSDGSTDNPRVVTVNNDMTLTAEFAQNHTLSIYADGCDAPNVVTCASGTEVSVTASAVLPGSYFVRWSDGSTDNPRLVTVNNDMTLTAEFASAPLTYTITCVAEHAQVEGAGEYDYGEEVTLTITPEEGYLFVQWTDDNTENPRTIVVVGDATYEAICEPQMAMGWEQIETTESGVHKLLEDGIIYILRDGERFTITGSKVE